MAPKSYVPEGKSFFDITKTSTSPTITECLSEFTADIIIPDMSKNDEVAHFPITESDLKQNDLYHLYDNHKKHPRMTNIFQTNDEVSHICKHVYIFLIIKLLPGS